jgi:hypothetical protein
VPLFISMVVYAALNYEIPLAISPFGPLQFTRHKSFGLEITAVAPSAVLGTGGVWIVWWLGTLRGLFVTCLLSVLALSIDLFQRRPRRARCARRNSIQRIRPRRRIHSCLGSSPDRTVRRSLSSRCDSPGLRRKQRDVTASTRHEFSKAFSGHILSRNCPSRNFASERDSVESTRT